MGEKPKRTGSSKHNRVEKELKETRDYLEKLLNYANAPIIVWNPSFRITQFNHAFEHLTGYTTEEVVGQKLNILFPEETRDKSLNKIERTLGGEYWESVEIPILCKAGDVRIALWNSANIYADDDKTLLATIAQGQDITERKQAEEMLKRQRDELATHSRILGAIRRTRDLDERINLILDEVMAFLNVEIGSIHLVQGNEIVLRCWRGISDSFRAHLLTFPPENPPDFLYKPCIIRENLNQQGIMSELLRREGIQVLASIPLNLPQQGESQPEEWLGTIILGSRRREVLNEDDVRVIIHIANQLGVSIDHARFYRKAQERLIRLQTLRDIDKAIMQHLNLIEVMHVVLERIPKEFGADAAAISLLDERQLQAKIFAMRLPDGTIIEKESFTLADSLLYWFIERQEPIIIYDLTQDPRVQMHRNRFRNGKLISYLGVPLVVKDRTIGILHILTNKPKVFLDEDVEFFSTMAGQTAIAIGNAQANEKLQASEYKYRSLVENVKDVIFTISPDSVFTSLNIAFETITGWSCAEWIGKSFTSLIHSDDMPLALKMFKLALQGETSPIFELRIFSKSGVYVVGEIKITPQIQNGKIVGILGIGRDITERKNLEAQLLQAQKMEAVGQLAGGVAHDFNNILTAIIGYASVLQMKMSKDDPFRHNVDQILASSERAANLTQSLLAFSRKQIFTLKPVRLNEIIKRIEKLLLRIIGEDIELKTTLTEEDLTILADSGQIEQVLMNLATNAKDAMPEGGLLSISTESVELDEEYPKTHGYGKPGMYAIISVSDTGEGIDEETRKKIFEPFFTTKEVGRGTGLGLAIVYAIVKQHNGYINVYSELGKGTTFKIYLPLTKVEVKDVKPTEPAPFIGGTETILLAEDDADVRMFTKTVLEEFGYMVIEAVDGEEAISRFMENKDKIQLLILDVIMPKKNGKEVYEEIKKVKPDIKALFMSGYSANIIHKKGILEEGLQFVLKPISPMKLLRKVREMLDK